MNSWISSDQNLDFLDFAISFATLEADSVCSACRNDMIDNAFEMAGSKKKSTDSNY